MSDEAAESSACLRQRERRVVGSEVRKATKDQIPQGTEMPATEWISFPHHVVDPGAEEWRGSTMLCKALAAQSRAGSRAARVEVQASPTPRGREVGPGLGLHMKRERYGKCEIYFQGRTDNSACS